jgi:hypothetical protein
MIDKMKSLNPNNLGLLVEECQKIKISDFLQKCRNGFKDTLIASELEVMGVNVRLGTSKTCYNGIRFWFKCPACNHRIGVLFKHPLTGAIGCRKCLNLEYRKRRYKGMAEGKL